MARQKKRGGNTALAVVNPNQAVARAEQTAVALPVNGRLGRMFSESEGFRSEGALQLERNWNRIGTALHRMQAMTATAADVAEHTVDQMEQLLVGEGLLPDDRGPDKR